MQLTNTIMELPATQHVLVEVIFHIRTYIVLFALNYALRVKMKPINVHPAMTVTTMETHA